MPNLVQIVPNFYISDSCSKILWQDETQLYNSVLHPRGYDDTGVNSTDPDDVNTNTAYLDITPLSTNIKYTVQIPSTIFDKANIGTTGFSQYKILPVDIANTNIPDDVYKCTYRFKLISTGQEISTTVYLAVTCTVDCCIDGKLSALKCCNDCSDESNNRKIHDLYRAHMLRDKIAYQISCNNPTGAQETINCLQQYCNSKPCTNCK